MDETVIEALCIRSRHPTEDEITRKSFPARGITQVFRLLPDIVRAAHFGYYDILVLHADVDNTPNHVPGHENAECRGCMLTATVQSATHALGPRTGMGPILTVLALPRQATDAWLLWGREDGDGAKLEAMDRHHVKHLVFGDTKYGHTAMAVELVKPLLARLDAAEVPPPSLYGFLARLTLIGAAPDVAHVLT